MDGIEVEDAVVQHIINITQVHAQLKLFSFCASPLFFENKILSFLGLAIESNILHMHVHNFQSSIVPVLKWREKKEGKNYECRVLTCHLRCLSSHHMHGLTSFLCLFINIILIMLPRFSFIEADLAVWHCNQRIGARDGALKLGCSCRT